MHLTDVTEKLIIRCRKNSSGVSWRPAGAPAAAGPSFFPLLLSAAFDLLGTPFLRINFFEGIRPGRDHTRGESAREPVRVPETGLLNLKVCRSSKKKKKREESGREGEKNFFLKARQVSKCKNCKIYILPKNKKVAEVYIKRAKEAGRGRRRICCEGESKENYTVGIGI